MLDALRGFALLGIFITNVQDLSGYTFLSPASRLAIDLYGVDIPFAAVGEFLIRGKFFSLFSLLFGIGFAVQIDSAARRGANFQRHFIRRLSALFAIGMLHACVWYGDILNDYALIGFILLATARWSITTAVRAAVLVLALRTVWPLIMWAAISITTTAGSQASPVDDFTALTNALYGIDPLAAFVANMNLVRLKLLQIIYDGRVISILAMFLIGALVGRLRLYQNPAAHTDLIRRVFRVCVPIGVLGNLVLVRLHGATPVYPPTGLWVVEQCLYSIAVPAMALTYASGFALLWVRGWHRVLQTLAPAGRMALTNYICQTLISVFLFYGIGLGLGSTIGYAQATVVAISIFVAQCVVSKIWLQFFHFGPLEWVWRRATYGTPVRIVR
jgi:uncharacterized protein